MLTSLRLPSMLLEVPCGTQVSPKNTKLQRPRVAPEAWEAPLVKAVKAAHPAKAVKVVKVEAAKDPQDNCFDFCLVS